jgi:hypothetical protein
MTLSAGLIRHRASSPDLASAESWTIPEGSGWLTAALVTDRSAASNADWLLPPLPVVQFGLKREVAPGHARVVHGQYRTERLAEAAALSRSLFSQVASRNGFVGTLVATDQIGGRTFSVSLWEHAEDSEADITGRWFQDQVRRFDDIYLRPPQIIRANLVPTRGQR